MVKYVENKFDEDYIQTLGVNFMEKTITLRNTEITFSIWDLGGVCSIRLCRRCGLLGRRGWG
jgi:GTPase SAR1 family protein